MRITMRGLLIAGALAGLLAAPVAIHPAAADDSIRQDRQELRQDRKELRSDERDLNRLEHRENHDLRTGQYGDAARTQQMERQKEAEIRKDRGELHQDQRDLRQDYRR
jgi:hypothetical protein